MRKLRQRSSGRARQTGPRPYEAKEIIEILVQEDQPHAGEVLTLLLTSIDETFADEEGVETASSSATSTMTGRT
jgi:hypothetical protein